MASIFRRSPSNRLDTAGLLVNWRGTSIANEFFEYVPAGLGVWLIEDHHMLLLRRNTASQVVGCQMVNTADGSAFTGTASVSVTLDGGAQSAGGGSVTHEGNGYHTYLPTQAETNANLIGYTFTGSGAVPRTILAHGVAFNPFDAAALGLTNLDATVSSRLAGASYTTPPTVAAIADGVWDEATTGHTAAGSFGEQLKTDVDAILDDTGTSGVIVVTNNDKTGYAIGTGGIGSTSFASGAINATALAADAVDEILDEQIGDSAITMRQALKLLVATLGGKVSGAGTSTITFRNAADDTDVIVATVDGAGNRTAITRTL